MRPSRYAVAALSVVAVLAAVALTCWSLAGWVPRYTTIVRVVTVGSPAPRATGTPPPPSRAASAAPQGPPRHPASTAATQANTPPPKLPRAAGPSAPQILSIRVSPSVVRAGSVVHASVRTTPNVVAVTAYAAGQSIAMPRVGIGAFAGSTTLPALPSFVHGSFGVTFRALDARGAMTQAATSVTVP